MCVWEEQVEEQGALLDLLVALDVKKGTMHKAPLMSLR
jgi:hypothetical protein